MESVTLIGIDLGKHSFHLHGQDRHGNAVFRKKATRRQMTEFFSTFHSCTVVMEACAGAHHMARQLAEFGHRIKLILHNSRAVPASAVPARSFSRQLPTRSRFTTAPADHGQLATLPA